MLVQAESGVVSLTGTPEAPAEGRRRRWRTSRPGMYAYSSILAALYQRAAHRPRRAHRHLDARMPHRMDDAAAVRVARDAGKCRRALGMRHNMIVPYGAYRLRRWRRELRIQNEREWRPLLRRRCCRRRSWPRRAFRRQRRRASQNRVELEAAHRRIFHAPIRAPKSCAGWSAPDIANGALNNVADVVAHPQLAARGRWTEVDSPGGPHPRLLPPHNLPHAPPAMGAVPALGEHTARSPEGSWRIDDADDVCTPQHAVRPGRDAGR